MKYCMWCGKPCLETFCSAACAKSYWADVREVFHITGFTFDVSDMEARDVRLATAASEMIEALVAAMSRAFQN